MGRVCLLGEGEEEVGWEGELGITTQRMCCVTGGKETGREGGRGGLSWSACTLEEVQLLE